MRSGLVRVELPRRYAFEEHLVNLRITSTLVLLSGGVLVSRRTSGRPKNIATVASEHVPKKKKAALMFHLANISGTLYWNTSERDWAVACLMSALCLRLVDLRETVGLCSQPGRRGLTLVGRAFHQRGPLCNLGANDSPTGDTPELKPNAHKHMKEISAVERAVLSGSCDMMPMARSAVDSVVPAAIAMGRRPKKSEVKNAPRIPHRPIMLLSAGSNVAQATHDTIILPRNGFFIPASWKKSDVSSAQGWA